MVDETSIGGYTAVSGTAEEVLQNLKDNNVVRDNVLGFTYNSSTDMAVIYNDA